MGILREWYAVRIYLPERNLVREIEFKGYPTDKEIERCVLEETGTEGYAEIVKRYKPIIPFA